MTKVSFRILSVIFVLTFAALACGLPSPAQLLQSEPVEVVEGVSPDTPVNASEALPTLVSETGAVPVVQPPVDLVSQQDALIALHAKVSPGVVSIQVLTELGGGQGSGFVIDNDGHIVTNFHVVHGGTDIEVAFPSGLKVKGEIIGEDADSDLAIIKVDVPADQLVPLTLGDSSNLQVGQIVVAIGNPFGLNGTMTTGILSGQGRTLDSLNETPEGGRFYSTGDLLQTDAAINPGNSGGPLLNLNGEVIGVNRAIRTFNSTDAGEPLNSGVGFAISINIVKRVAPALIANGSYDYPYLGISSLNEITLDIANELGLERAVGVVITQVVPGGPSDDAGLQVSDVITAVDGQELNSFGDMISYLFNNTSPGDTITFTVFRDGSSIPIELVVGSRP
ncbi:MAG: PDZ domain-containing protein [Chloroflexi bacterium]|nr:MAG: PDZ domain-containing protein [Chloroflexota bacterium]MBL1193265.1 PDZ domain-containing protein [Chloroflexota bacterium]NOH10558.1 PDZ domain-containing protein [Chloroflexota bacterium]